MYKILEKTQFSEKVFKFRIEARSASRRPGWPSTLTPASS